MYNDHEFDPLTAEERDAHRQEEELRRKIRREVLRVQRGDAEEELRAEREQEEAEREREERDRRLERRRQSNAFWLFFSGNILVRKGVSRYYRHLAAIAVMFFLSIFVIFSALRLDRKYARLEREVQLLRERSIRLQEQRYRITSHSSVAERLRERGIPYLYMGEHCEESPLGKSEWVVVAAEIAGLRTEGSRLFAAIPERYERLRALAQQTAARPRVMLNTPYRDTWFMPSSRSFMVRLIEDAGGEYVYTKNDSDTSVAVDLEEAYLLASAADTWINVGPCNTLAELTAQNPKFADVPAVRNRQVFNNNRRQTPAGGSDFWESGVIRPDLVLHDLCAVFNPQAADTAELYYYKRLE